MMEETSVISDYVPLSRSTWSVHFNHLTFIGVWAHNYQNPLKAQLFAFYQLIVLLLRLFAVYLILENLYSVRHNIKKVCWNMCVNNVYIGSIFKLLSLYHNHPYIDNLRWNLHKDSLSSNTPEDEHIEKEALKSLRMIRLFYYGFAFFFCPIWFVCRYAGRYWGEYEFPIPINMPFNMNPETSAYYLPLFLMVTGAGISGTHIILESELSMFSLFFQISREYDRFMKDILKLDNMYQELNEDESGNYPNKLNRQFSEEINPLLKKIKTKNLFKKLILRQQELSRYTETFEFCYNKGQFLHLIVTFLVIVFNAILVIYGSANLSPDVSFQFGLLILVILDVFLVCASSQKLKDQCHAVGFSLYSTRWYKMEPEFRKDLCLMIMRSQNPPRITAGKLLQINKSTFMETMKNIYSWLTLFHQLDIKVN